MKSHSLVLLKTMLNLSNEVNSMVPYGCGWCVVKSSKFKKQTIRRSFSSSLTCSGYNKLDPDLLHSPIPEIHNERFINLVEDITTNKEKLLFERALEQFRIIVGSSSVVMDKETLAKELADCSGNTSSNVPVIVYPSSHEQVVELVKVANHYKIALNPVSSGQNWGYGSALPANPLPNQRCVLLKLNKMKNIEMDRESGVVHLEPGVTQQELYDYLQVHQLEYLVPVTGAGPTCSLVSNALERGYGISPYIDHFGATTNMQVVLASGQVYQSMFELMGGKKVSTLYKWQTGPFVEGLFSQSNFGIVTKMSIALYPKPEKIETFFFSFDDLTLASKASKEILRQVNGVIGSVKLMNKYAMLPMTQLCPKDELIDGLVSDSYMDEFCKTNRYKEWNGAGNLYGSSSLVKAAKSDIKKILKKYGSTRNVFVSPGFVRNASDIMKKIPIVKDTYVSHYADVLSKALELFSGTPNETGLRIAYWKSGERPQDRPWNPSVDGAGIIWYNPIIPITPHDLNTFSKLVYEICKKHKIEPLITLTSLSDRCCVGTIPILFDRSNQDEMKRAKQCFSELMNSGREHGYVPYRLGIQSVDWLKEQQAVPPLVQTIKSALDPNNILSPGKYGI